MSAARTSVLVLVAVVLAPLWIPLTVVMLSWSIANSVTEAALEDLTKDG